MPATGNVTPSHTKSTKGVAEEGGWGGISVICNIVSRSLEHLLTKIYPPPIFGGSYNRFKVYGLGQCRYTSNKHKLTTDFSFMGHNVKNYIILDICRGGGGSSNQIQIGLLMLPAILSPISIHMSILEAIQKGRLNVCGCGTMTTKP